MSEERLNELFSIVDEGYSSIQEREIRDYITNLQQKVEQLETQQKEFIKYLEDEIKRLKENDIYQPLQKMALATHEHILQKYRSITGVSDEKK